MKQIRILAVLILALPALIAGCKSPNQTAYRTIAATEATVDHAMIGWGDYVLWWRVQPGYDAAQAARQEASVRAAYTDYRNTVNLVYAARAATVAPAPEMIQRVSDAAAALVTLINGFLPVERKP